MSRLETWLMLAIGIGLYIGLGSRFGWDVSALTEDAFPILFGAALGLVAHLGWEEDDDA